MAKAVKGCMNQECIANQKKINFSLDYDHCPKCGQKLSYVCKDCRMELDDDTRRYCLRCESRRKDDREQMGKVIMGKFGAGAKKVGDFAVDTGKKAANLVGDFAGNIKDKTEKRKQQKNTKENDEPIEVEFTEIIDTEDE